MPRLIPFRLAVACALALVLVLSAVATAAAKGPIVDLRVLNTGGKVLAERSLGTGTTSVKSSPQATCFGAGTGGNGKSVTIPGPTAMGALIVAAKFTAALRPVLITDHFSFGLGLCGIGGFVAHGEGSWYLKVNHVNPELGGDQVKVRSGDEVLWYLAPTFPYPDELALVAPDRAGAEKAFTVRVFSYDEKGKRRPVAGAKVTGATGPTGTDGRTTVALEKPARLIARHAGDIPSNREAVCLGVLCPGGTGK